MLNELEWGNDMANGQVGNKIVVKIVDTDGSEKTVKIPVNDSYPISPGQQATVIGVESSATGEVSLAVDKMMLQDEDLVMVFSDGSVLMLNDFFQPTAAGEETASITVADQTFRPPDFITTVVIDLAPSARLFALDLDFIRPLPQANVDLEDRLFPESDSPGRHEDLFVDRPGTVPGPPEPPQNLPPVAVNDFFTVEQGGQITYNILLNDFHLGGDTFTVQSVTGPVIGTLITQPDGTHTYITHPSMDTLGFEESISVPYFYLVVDPNGNTSSAQVNITVTGVNDPVVATDNAYSGTEDEVVITGNVITDDSGSGVDSDIDANDVLSIPASGQVVTTSDGVTLTLGSDGSFVYPVDTATMQTLSASETFTDSFTYTVTDGTATDTAQVTITIQGENDPPDAIDNAYTSTEDDAAVTGNVITDDSGSGVDSDPEGDPLSIPGTGLTVTTSGGVTLTLGTDGSFVYPVDTAATETLSASETFTDSFVYTVTDGTATDTALVTITITGNNDVVALDDNFGVLEDALLNGNVIVDNGNGADYDPEGDVFSVTSTGTLTTTSGGSVTMNSAGDFTYDQGGNFDALGEGETAQDTFTYTITDALGATSLATVTIIVTGVNEVVALDDSFTTLEDTNLAGNVFEDNGSGSDYDPEGDDFSVSSTGTITTAAGGEVTINSDGTFDYEQNGVFDSLSAGETAQDTFIYTITDGTATDTAQVTITVTGVNDAPDAIDNAYTATEDDTSITGNVIIDNSGSGVDSDPEGDPLSIPSTGLTVTTSGGVTLTLGTDGSFVYPVDTAATETLSASETFTDSFIYTVTDGTATDTAQVTITIQGANDAPDAIDNAYTATEDDTSVTGNVITDDSGSGVDSDPEGDPLSIPGTGLTVTTSGGVTLTLGTDGSFVYPVDTAATETLSASETFTDSFVYTVTDGTATDTALVTITITGNNDVVALDDDFGVLEDALLNGNVIADNGNGADYDPEGDAFSVTTTGILTTTAGGSVSMNSAGDFTYDQGGNFDALGDGETAQDTFTYTITDALGATSIATVTIVVTGENEVVALDDSFTAVENVNISANVFDDNGSGSDYDPEGDDFSVSGPGTITTAAGGEVTINSDGTFDYEQNGVFDNLSAGETAQDTFIYTITDGTATDTAQVTITVTGINDAPDAIDNAYTATEDDTSVTGNVITDDSGSGVDSDPEGDPLSIPGTGLTVTTSGGVTLTLGTDGSFIYPVDTAATETLSASETFTDSFVYTVTDGTATDTALVTITITGNNDVVALDDDFGVLEDALLNGNVIADNGNGADYDPEGDAFSVTTTGTLTTTAGGSVSMNSAGDFTYDQGGNFDALAEGETAQDTFTYTITDALGATSLATVTIIVTGVNEVVALDDSFTTLEDANLAGNVFDDNGSGSDYDPEGDDFSVSSTGTITTTAGGEVTINSDGTFDYEQNGVFDNLSAGETAQDTFIYTITDGTATDTAQVTITVTGTNDAPDAIDNAYTATEDDTSVTGNVITDDSGSGVDSDPEGDPLSIPGTGLTVTTSGGVTLTLGTDGSFVYPVDTAATETLSASETFTDSFVYTVTDGTATDTALVTITITGNNDVVALDDDFGVLEDALLNGNVIADNGNGADYDPEGDAFSVTTTGILTTTAGGSVSMNSAGDFTYDQGGNFDALGDGETAQDTFTYTITDALGATSIATVTIVVTGENEVVALDDSFTAVENVNISANVFDDNGSGSDYDPEGDDFSVSGPGTITTAAGGEVTINSDGTFDYEQNGVFDNLSAGETAQDTFIYTITDGTATDTAQVTITVTGTNDAPDAIDNAYTATEDDTSVTGNVITDDSGSGVDSDPEGDPLSIPGTGLTVTTSGGVTLTLGTDGSFVYPVDTAATETLSASETFTDSFVYTVTDGTATDTALVTITITGNNDVVALDDDFGVLEDALLNGNVIVDNGNGADYDPEGDAFSVTTTGTLTTTAGGSVSMNSAGDFTYDQGGNFDALAEGETAQDTFTYTITDALGATSLATVTIIVTGVNEVVALDDSFTTLENANLAGNVFDDNGSGSDYDPEGDDFSVSSTGTITTTAGGEVTINSDGTFTYDQDDVFDSLSDGETANDTFTYTIVDDFGATDTATVTITVEGVGDIYVNEIGLRNATSPDTGESNVDYIEFHNTLDNSPQGIGGMVIELDGVTGSSATSFTIPVGLEVPAGGFIVFYGVAPGSGFDQIDYEIYNSAGAIVESDTIDDMHFTFADSNGDGFVDTRDLIGVQVVSGNSSGDVVDTFVANGADFGADQRWTPNIGVPAAAVLLSAILGNETFNGEIGDQQSVLDTLGLTRPDADDSQPAAAASASTFARIFDDIGSDSAEDWTVTYDPTVGALNDASSQNPQDINPDDFNPNQGNSPPADSGQTVEELLAAGFAVGGEGNDFLYGSDFNDALFGNENNDFLFGGLGDDQLFGGSGADVVVDFSGQNLLVGSGGNDIIISNPAILGGQDLSGSDRNVLVGDDVAEGTFPNQFNVVFTMDATGSMAFTKPIGQNGAGPLIDPDDPGNAGNTYDVTIDDAISGANGTWYFRYTEDGTGDDINIRISDRAPGFSIDDLSLTELASAVIWPPGDEWIGGSPADIDLDITVNFSGGGSTTIADGLFVDFDTAPIISSRQGYIDLAKSFIDDGFADNTLIQLVTFTTSSTLVGSARMPDDMTLWDDINAVLPSGGTQYEDALQEAADWLQSVAANGGDNIIYFLTDGEDNDGFSPSQDLLDDLEALDVEIRVFGLANAEDPDDANNLNIPELDAVSQAGGDDTNEAMIVPPSEADALGALFAEFTFASGDVGADVFYGSALDEVIWGDSLNIDFVVLSENTGIPEQDLRDDFAADPRTFILDNLDGVEFHQFFSVIGLGDWIDAGAGDDIIYGQGGDDEIIGGLGVDIIYAGRGDDMIVFDNADSLIDGEAGFDTLIFDSSGETLDLTAAGKDDVYSNLEVVDLTGTGGNTLVLDINDVFEMTDTDNVLIVDGTNADTVDGNNGAWTLLGPSASMPGYTEYTDATGTMSLFVDSDINQINF